MQPDTSLNVLEVRLNTRLMGENGMMGNGAAEKESREEFEEVIFCLH